MAHPQMSLSMQQDAGFEKHRKTTRRDVFLAEMDRVVPWASLVAVIEPHYPKPREDGRYGAPFQSLRCSFRLPCSPAARTD